MSNNKVRLGYMAIILLASGCSSMTPKPEIVADVQAPVAVTDMVEQAAPQQGSESTLVPDDKPADVAVKTEKAIEAPSSPIVSASPKETPAPVIAEKTNENIKPREIPTDPNTFLVVTDLKPATHPNYGKGDTYGFTVNAIPGKELVVKRGSEYVFKVDTGVKHDFYLTTSPVGWGAATYGGGVEGQFTYLGDVTFKPNKETPSLLFYQCRNHKSMGGSIYVLNEGESLSAVKSKLDAENGGKKTVASNQDAQVSERTVKQKLSYAQMLLMGKNIKDLEKNADGKVTAEIDKAKMQVESAKTLLANGDNASALKNVDESIRTVMALSIASAQASKADSSVQKAEYDELLTALNNYENSYERNVKRAEKAKQTLKARLNKDEYNQMVSDAKRMADADDYKGANDKLHQAQNLITNTLTEMLQSQTVVYDKNFETPKEEYEYELARLESYEELMPIAVEQKQPSKGLMMLMDTYVKKGQQIKSEGQAIAAKGDYKMAIMAMQAATDNMIRALRTVGVQ